MKKITILTLALSVASFGFAVDNSTDIPILRRPIEREPAPGLEIQLKNEGEKSGLAKGTSYIEKKTPLSTPVTVERVKTELLAPRKAHFYLRMNVLEPSAEKRKPLIPGMGVGYRKAVGYAAIDISGEYCRGRPNGKGVFIALPKISYLYFFSPLKTQSVYAGPALAYGRIKTGKGDRFEGLIPSASLGLEISRTANFLSFFQLDVGYPLIAAKSKGARPGVSAELAFGAGF